MRAWLATAWMRATDLAGTRRGALVLVVAALVVFAVQSVGWPVAPGRDLSAYLVVYVDFWNGDPVLPWSMANRTPRWTSRSMAARACAGRATRLVSTTSSTSRS